MKPSQKRGRRKIAGRKALMMFREFERGPPKMLTSGAQFLRDAQAAFRRGPKSVMTFLYTLVALQLLSCLAITAMFLCADPLTPLVVAAPLCAWGALGVLGWVVA